MVDEGRIMSTGLRPATEIILNLIRPIHHKSRDSDKFTIVRVIHFYSLAATASMFNHITSHIHANWSESSELSLENSSLHSALKSALIILT